MNHLSPRERSASASEPGERLSRAYRGIPPLLLLLLALPIIGQAAVLPGLFDDSAALTETQRRGNRQQRGQGRQPAWGTYTGEPLTRKAGESLSDALVRWFADDPDQLKPKAAKLSHDPRATPADQATGTLVLAIASDGRGWHGEPLEKAVVLFQQAGDLEGLQLARAFRARELATTSRGLPEKAAEQVKPLLEQLIAGRRVPLADLNGARAAEAIADRLAQVPGDSGPRRTDPTPWFTQAAVLATLAGGDANKPALMRSVAANLAMQARLESRLFGGQPLELETFDADFAKYDQTINQTLLEQDGAADLWLSVSGLVENLGRWLQLTSGKMDSDLQSRYAQRTLLLTQASLPLADDLDEAAAGAERLYGLPAGHDLQEPGMRACRVLSGILGSQPTEELTLFAGDRKFGSFQEFAFWFLERTKSTELSRKLAEMRGTATADATEQRRLATLKSERSSLAVQTVHHVADMVLAKRHGQEPRNGFVPRGKRDGDPRQMMQQHRELAQEILTLELGNTAEAKETAALLTRPLTTAEAQQLLPDQQTAVVAISYDWSFIIAPRSVTWRPLTAPGPPRMVMQLAGQIGDPTADPAERLRAAKVLYDSYLRPLADDLTGIDRLLLVPEGPLACLPFEALVSGAGGQDGALPASWAQAAVAADRYTMEYIPSLTMMAIATAKARHAHVQPTSTLLAVGDVALGQAVQLGDDGTRFVLVPTRSGADNELLALPHTGEEVHALAKAIAPRPATVLTGAEATAARVKQEMGHYAILHFATHGLIADDRDPLSSALLLSPDADGNAGTLTAREVYDAQLPAQLAVLSACDTATGRMRFVSGGVTSLAGAFLYAGVPNVVASLWPVDDAATAKFMELFYSQAVGHPGSEGQALQAARQALRTADGGKWADPYYWSAFLLFR